jgi:hypothetical protein
MPAYPFLCLLVARGFSAARRGLARVISMRRRARGEGPGLLPFVSSGLGVALAAVVLVAPIRETLHAHPFGLSAYGPIVGGAPGAATLGLNRTFWGYTTESVAPALNRVVKPNGTVYIHDTHWLAWPMFVEDGRVRSDIQAVGAIEAADVGLYHHEPHMLGQEYQNWVAFGTIAPSEIAGLDGVPVIWMYQRR